MAGDLDSAPAADACPSHVSAHVPATAPAPVPTPWHVAAEEELKLLWTRACPHSPVQEQQGDR